MRWSLRHCYEILRWHLVREYLEAFVHSVLKAEGRRIMTTKIHDCRGLIWIPQPNSNSSLHMRPFHEVKDICYLKICWSLSAVVAITKQRKHPTKHGKYGTLWTNNLNNIAYKQCLMSTPTTALPSSLLHIEGAHKPLCTSLTNYSPPALWQWVYSQDPQPMKSIIGAEQYKCCWRRSVS